VPSSAWQQGFAAGATGLSVHALVGTRRSACDPAVLQVGECGLATVVHICAHRQHSALRTSGTFVGTTHRLFYRAWLQVRLSHRQAPRRLHFCEAAAQRRGFEAQLGLARAARLPLFLHMRAAAPDFLDIMRRAAPGAGPAAPSAGGAERGMEEEARACVGVVHSFTGARAELDELLALRPPLAIGTLHGGMFVEGQTSDSTATRDRCAAWRHMFEGSGVRFHTHGIAARCRRQAASGACRLGYIHIQHTLR
jgi:Tat protein secretion system quality control protein TatD with DNase activity